MTHRFGTLIVAALFALSLPLGAALAAGEPDPPPRNPPPQQPKNNPPSQGTKKKKNRRSPSRNSATAIAPPTRWCRPGDYKAAFAAFKALDADDTPDVANYLGYTARKLGDYDALEILVRARARRRPEARAHLAVLRHVARRAGQHAQGAGLPREDPADLRRHACKEYQDLKGGIEGNVTY